MCLPCHVYSTTCQPAPKLINLSIFTSEKLLEFNFDEHPGIDLGVLRADPSSSPAKDTAIDLYMSESTK
jgi:hypothetical protein